MASQNNSGERSTGERRTISGEGAPGDGQDEPQTPGTGEPDGSKPAAPAAPPAAAGAPGAAAAAPAQRMGVAPPYAPTPRIGIPTQAVPSAAPAPGAPPDESEGRASDSSPPPEGGPDDKKARSERKNRFEALLPGIIRRGIERSIEAGLNTFEKSLETGRETTGAVREVLNEVKAPRDVANAVGKAFSEAKLPRELASAVIGQLDETKNDVLRILAREFREFLDSTDLSGALKEALTSLSFEIRTEIRFIPNDAGDGVKADVRARSRVKRNPPPPRERRRRSARKPEEDDEGED